MPVSLLERAQADVRTMDAPQPELQAKLAEGGNAGLPPEVPQAAIAAPEPPEIERFNPDEAEKKADTDAKFPEIAAQLGDVAAGSAIIEQADSAQVEQMEAKSLPTAQNSEQKVA